MPRIVRALGLLLTLLALAAPTAAHADSITVSRAPAPPGSVLNDGAHSLSYSYTIGFTDTPQRVRTEIIAPGGTVVPGTVADASITGATSPYNSSPQTYTVPAGLAPGHYYVRVLYYSSELCNSPSCPSPGDDSNYAAEAQAQFDIAASVGNITITKFEDVNGDGVRQPSEPGVANWTFQVTAPNPDYVGTTTYTVQTGADGTVTLPNVPAGPSANYTVSEVLPNPNSQNWAPVTASSQSFTLASGATATPTFGGSGDDRG